MKEKRMLKKILVFVITAMVLVFCAVSVQATDKATYTIKKYKTEKTYGRVTGKFEFQLPQLSGTSAAVKKINKDLKKEYKKALESKENILEYAKNMGKTSTSKNVLFSTTTCKVTYNKKGIVSFCFTQDWFAGGVHNLCHEGCSYDLKTGKKLKLTDVIKNAYTDLDVKYAITDAYYKKLGNSFTYSEIFQSVSSKYSYNSIGFYLKNGKVIVSTGAYGPVVGNGELPVKLSGRY
ncbi:MAG: PdaC/SigV domain-containing protein [Muricoprocola sp.]